MSLVACFVGMLHKPFLFVEDTIQGMCVVMLLVILERKLFKRGSRMGGMYCERSWKENRCVVAGLWICAY